MYRNGSSNTSTVATIPRSCFGQLQARPLTWIRLVHPSDYLQRRFVNCLQRILLPATSWFSIRTASRRQKLRLAKNLAWSASQRRRATVQLTSLTDSVSVPKDPANMLTAFNLLDLSQVIPGPYFPPKSLNASVLNNFRTFLCTVQCGIRAALPDGEPRKSAGRKTHAEVFNFFRQHSICSITTG